jgi:tetratricopeptide (TPR) repeat protein
MFKDRPLAGWGADGFATARPRFRTDDIDVRHAHGYLAQTMSDLGAAGLILSLLLLAAWLAAASLAICTASGPYRTALVTLTATVVVFGVHSLIDWTWFTAGTALVAMLAAGFVAGAAPAGRRAVLLGGHWRSAAAAIVAVLALAAAWSAWQPLRASNAADDALAAADRGQFDEARGHAARAHDLNPLSAEPLQALASVERRAGRNDAAEAALRDAVGLQPASYTTWLRLAEFQLWVQDDPRQALESVRAALYLNPGSFTVIQRYLDIYRTLRARDARGG